MARARVVATGRRAMGGAGGRARGVRRAVRAALPPANEIAGFVVGAALVGMCVAGTRLDGFIARAQARGLEDGSGARRRTVTRRDGSGGGGVFVVPDDDEVEDGAGG
ncbi:unnamed product [Ostreococcus tauri]|uniref:Unnamed product n=1 Tax=Ostreococcus tauri TaxID=70448 RepID=A0A096P7X4_OSTTA|nr:unnamed product [Ostreococcus tauri]CEG00078.1 unnamed product [Ostreococcus tauri]|eukprot:XP_022840187.1 unnamed product [Ostreococcus tauri]